MMRILKGRIAGRWVACLIVAATAAWLLPVFLENRQNALAEEIAQEQYESQLRYHYGQHAYLPVGTVGELFARVR
jgi:hypothetical protein